MGNQLLDIVHIKVIKQEITTPQLKHIVGIDQLRYVFAIWVFFAHDGRPPFFAGHAKTQLFDFVDKFYLWIINGQAAVIGFFIISGLCIHYPNIRRTTFNLKSFYTARFLRLSLPLIACLSIAKLVNYQHQDGFLRVVPIWSLYCELIYYILYPFVLWLVKKGWIIHLIVLTGIISFLFILIYPDERAMYFHEFGGGGILYWKAALLALPCWLLGVLIGERISEASKTNNAALLNHSLWPWRIGAICLSVVISPLYRIGLYFKLIFHPFAGLIFTSQVTLLLFGVYAFLWLEKEVLYNNFGKSTPSKLLEHFGLASYSLYLIHILVLWISEKVPAEYFPGYLIFWILLVLLLHGLVFIFYNVIEKPSHKLAKLCATYLRG